MSTEDKLINVIVKYALEGTQDVAAGSSDIDKKLAQGYAALEEHYKGNSDALKQFVKDNNDASNTVTVGLKKITNESENTAKSFHSLRQAGFELRQIGTILTLGGGLLTAGLVADANNYVKTVGNINAGNAQWLGYENQIKSANLEIGQTARDAILPTMKQSAQLIQDMAQVVKDNPWILQIALGVGSVMLVLGSATVVISELIRVVADIGLLIGKITATQVAQVAAGGINAAGGVGTAEYLPGGAGSLAASQATGLGLGGMALVIGAVIAGFAQLITVMSASQNLYKGVTDILVNLGWETKQDAIALEEHRQTLLRFVEDLPIIGSIAQAAFGKSTAASPSAIDPQTAQQEVQDFINYQKQMKDASDNYSQQRLDIIQTSEQQMADVTQAYESQRADIIANFARQQAMEARNFGEQQAIAARNFGEQQDKALRNYNEQVTKSNRDFAESQANAVKKHNLEMAQLAQDHDVRMKDLAANRDALGLVKEKQSYNLQVQQKDQTFAQQQAQNIQQHRQQLADQRAAFLQQQSDAQANYDQQRSDAQAAHAQQMADQAAAEAEQLAKLDANHKIEMAKLDAQEKDKLAKLDEAYRKQVDQIQTAFIDRLRALDAAIFGDTAAFDRYMANEATQFQTWLNGMKSQIQAQTNAMAGPTLASKTVGVAVGGTRQSGGYASFMGPGENGLPEYVLDNPTTKMMEQMMGGSLSQAAMLSAVMAGRNAGASGGGGRNVTITIVGKGLTMTEIQAITEKNIDMRLGDLLPAFGGR